MATREPSHWTFLSNYGHVLLCLAQNPEIRLRDLAQRVGVTERAAQRIVTELEAEGYISRFRTGRRNRYTLHPELPLRHPLEAQHTVGQLIAALGREGEDRLPSEANPRSDDLFQEARGKISESVKA